MKFIVCFISIFAMATSEHLILGNKNDVKYLIHHSSLNYYGIPFMQREKHWFYSGPTKINCGDPIGTSTVNTICSFIKDSIPFTEVRHAAIMYLRVLYRLKSRSSTMLPKIGLTKSIMVYDNLHTKGIVNVTAGGIGFTFVNLSFRSERGQEMDYDIGLYTK